VFLLLSLIDAGARWRQSATIKETKTYTELHFVCKAGLTCSTFGIRGCP